MRLFTLLLLITSPCFAVGGTCPSGANYINSANPTGAFVTLSSLGVTSCFFISQAGLDTNTGIDEAHPWKHMPGMASCANTCSSTTPAAAEGFILRGCDTWVNADMPILWNWSGSSGSPIYIGVDKTWFNSSVCPSTWNRPIWNAQKTDIATRDAIFTPSWSGNTSFVTLDNIEMIQLNCVAPCNEDPQGYVVAFNDMDHWIEQNLYLHAWNIPSDNNCKLVKMGAAPTNNKFWFSVIDGSDATGASPAGGTCFGLANAIPNEIGWNVIHDLTNPIVGNSGTTTTFIHDNRVYNGTGSNSGVNHPNMIEILNNNGRTELYNNVVYNQEAAGAFYVALCSNSDAWNNVIYNGGSSDNQPPITLDDDCGSDTTFTSNYYNNTLQTGGATAIRVNGRSLPGVGPVVVKNNHFIDSNGSTATDGTGAVCYNQPGSCDPVVSYTESNSVPQTNAAANANSSPHFDQYASGQTFAFSPVASTNSTVGAGTNLSSSATGNLASLQNDTSYACTQQTVSGVVQVVCPARTVNARPGSGAWNSGAYQFTTASAPTGTPAPWLFTMLVYY